MPTLPDPSPGARRFSHATALWLQGFILLAFLAASSAPSPLYAIYQQAWGFSTLTLTVLFSSYAVALIGALLVFGHLSNHRGRREVVLVSLALQLLGLYLLFAADSAGWLLGARIIQGLSTGMATSALGAWLVDLDRERGALVNAVAPMVGLAVGAMGTSALMELAPAPTQLPFALLMLVFVLLGYAAWYLPETVARQSGAWRSLVPSFTIPARARPTLWELLPLNSAQWALAGFYLSLGPMLAGTVTGSAAPVTGGTLIAAMVLSSALAMAAFRDRPPRPTLTSGAAGLVIGIAVALSGVRLSSGALLFAGTVISGFAFGAAFNASMRSLVPLARPHERASLLSAFFVLSYLAFSLPAIGAGLLVEYLGLRVTTIVYGGALAVMAATSWIALRLRAPVSTPRDDASTCPAG